MGTSGVYISGADVMFCLGSGFLTLVLVGAVVLFLLKKRVVDRE